MTIRWLVAASLCWSAIAAGQPSLASKPYEVEDAYQIYSLLLPHEESYGFAKGELIIQQDTVQTCPASVGNGKSVLSLR
jgi:hypothetical protein